MAGILRKPSKQNVDQPAAAKRHASPVTTKERSPEQGSSDPFDPVCRVHHAHSSQRCVLCSGSIYLTPDPAIDCVK